MSSITVSVIIITHNNPTIFECVKSIKSQINEDDEIIVIDDHSSAEYYSALEIFCINNSIVLANAVARGNRAHNRNLGSSLATKSILIFVDSDIILLNTSIYAIKKAYKTNDSIAYIGTRCAGRYDPLRLSLLNGIDIQESISKNVQFDFLHDIPSIMDKRISNNIYIENITEQKYYWIYYYTCCCTVERSLFIKIGGFDEKYTGWGVEDIDLGYRISLLGKISFLRGFRGIHIPHKRDILYAENDNCRNLKLLLKKVQRYDIEIISKFRISAKQLAEFKHFLDRMRMINIPVLQPVHRINTLYINCVSTTTPNGCMRYFDEKGNDKEYSIIGISTFFDNKSIENVFVSINIFLYPISLICAILQECIRIGKTVIIDGILPNYRIDWDGFFNLSLLQPQRRNEYIIHDLMEIKFEKINDKNQYVVTSDYLDLETPRNIPAKIQLNLNHISSTYCVINLTRGTGYRLLLKQIKDEIKVDFVGIYSASSDLDLFNAITTFPLHLYGLLLLDTPILLIVENIDNFNWDFSNWNDRNRANDIIIDLLGNIM